MSERPFPVFSGFARASEFPPATLTRLDAP